LFKTKITAVSASLFEHSCKNLVKGESFSFNWTISWGNKAISPKSPLCGDVLFMFFSENEKS
jgi:hypothetical protein